MMFASISQINQRIAADYGQEMLHTVVPQVPAVVEQYAPISLSEMASVALLNRTDTKFVMAAETLLAGLSQLQNDYRVLEIEGVRLYNYRTLYFDTADFTLCYRHHAGALDRYKVRSRAYLDSRLSFFEVKHKTNKKRTIKNRLQTPHIKTSVNRDTARFLTDYYPHEAAELLLALWNSFVRVTLVSNHRPERLTLDFDLAFQIGPKRLSLPGVAIAEVKRDGFFAYSDFVQQMRLLGVRPTSFSKYCLGVSYFYPELKHNNFKPKHLLVQKLMRGDSHGYYR